MGFRPTTAVMFFSIAALAGVPLVFAEPSKTPEARPAEKAAAEKPKGAAPAPDAAQSATTAKSKDLEEVRYEAAPRAKQIEPVVVAPVKRKMPKTPDIKVESDATDKPKQQVVTIEKDPTLERRATSTKSAAKSCGAGTKRSRDGTKCERVASVAKKNGKRR